MALIIGFLPPMKETWVDCLAAGVTLLAASLSFYLAQDIIDIWRVKIRKWECTFSLLLPQQAVLWSE